MGFMFASANLTIEPAGRDGFQGLLSGIWLLWGGVPETTRYCWRIHLGRLQTPVSPSQHTSSCPASGQMTHRGNSPTVSDHFREGLLGKLVGFCTATIGTPLRKPMDTNPMDQLRQWALQTVTFAITVENASETAVTKEVVEHNAVGASRISERFFAESTAACGPDADRGD